MQLDNNIHIWQIPLEWSTEQLDLKRAVLSTEECSQGERFIRAEHRRRYLASHAALRIILSEYLNEDPAQLHFSVGEHGKPYLSGEYAESGLMFNLSGSHELALLAVATDRDVGVDVELIKPAIDAEGIVGRFFSDNERRQWGELPESDQLAGFYRCWTRKEAFVKALGQGLSFPLSRFDVHISSMEMDCLQRLDDDQPALSAWSLGPLLVSPEYKAALAVKGGFDQIKYRAFKLL